MPSWSASEAQEEQAATPPSSADSKLEAASRLLEELFSEAPDNERPLQPEQ